MANFDRSSRYARAGQRYEVTDIRGRSVLAVPTPEPPVELAAGVHVKKQGQTLDQLANGYLTDPHGYWRIAELNGVLVPDALEERDMVLIPVPTR
jgi:hypothetical protein